MNKSEGSGTSAKEVLGYFDQGRMWQTLLQMSRPDDERAAKEKRYKAPFYDPKMVLCILLEVLAPGNKVDSREFITQNALSFCFAATSLPEEELRCLAYAVLTRYLKRLSDEQRDKPSFSELPLFTFAIKCFKNSIEEKNQRICHVVSHFFARLAKLMLAPEDPVYAPLMAFLTLKPTMSLEMVPEFLKLFFSSSTAHYRAERQWILRLCTDAMIGPHDYQVMCKIFVLESCQALFASPVADLWSKSTMLQLFLECVTKPSVARDLLHRLNFATWIAQTVEHPMTTQFEEQKLAEIFAFLVRNTLQSQESEEVQPSAKRRKPDPQKEAAEKARAALNKLIVRQGAQRILSRLEKQKHHKNAKKQSKRLRKIIRALSVDHDDVKMEESSSGEDEEEAEAGEEEAGEEEAGEDEAGSDEAGSEISH